jgi:hypothetical protein
MAEELGRQQGLHDMQATGRSEAVGRRPHAGERAICREGGQEARAEPLNVPVSTFREAGGGDRNTGRGVGGESVTHSSDDDGGWKR